MDQVRGGKSCVTTRFRGKVNNNLPPKYNDFDTSNESPLKKTRGAKAGRKPAEGKGKGKKRGGGGIAQGGRGGEDGLDSGDETENEINEIIEEWEDFSEQAKMDAENREQEQRNLLVVLNTLFNCFPREIVQDIKELTKDNNSEDHVWIKQIVDNALLSFFLNAFLFASVASSGKISSPVTISQRSLPIITIFMLNFHLW